MGVCVTGYLNQRDPEWQAAPPRSLPRRAAITKTVRSTKPIRASAAGSRRRSMNRQRQHRQREQKRSEEQSGVMGRGGRHRQAPQPLRKIASCASGPTRTDKAAHSDKAERQRWSTTVRRSKPESFRSKKTLASAAKEAARAVHPQRGKAIYAQRQQQNGDELHHHVGHVEADHAAKPARSTAAAAADRWSAKNRHTTSGSRDRTSGARSARRKKCGSSCRTTSAEAS